MIADLNHCWLNHISLKLLGIGTLALLSLSLATAINAQQPVVFDVPAIVLAERINPCVVSIPTTGGQLFRVRLSISSFLAPEFRGRASEYAFELNSPHQSMRVLDYWPKNETYSATEGTIKVDARRQKDEHFKFDLGASYPTIGSAQASGNYRNNLNVQESYIRKPQLQQLTSSGTIHQGYGALFKFRSGPVDLLEGSREIAILFEASPNWRADLIQVLMTAVGQSSSFGRPQVLAQSRQWVTVHREGDAAAAAQAARYVQYERALRSLAASQGKQVAERTWLTLWHKAGSALNLVESKIPIDYLDRALFGAASRDGADGTERLPIELRVAILDYWQERERLCNLAKPDSQSPMLVNNSAG